jgi:large subunit ribosomal protein L15
MQPHNLQRATKRKKKKLIGRGGKRGKTSGRGTKGQKARSGHKMRPEMRDIIKRIPKLRGRGVNALKTISARVSVVNLKTLAITFPDGGAVTPEILLEKRLIRRISGVIPVVKLLGDGEVTKAYQVSGCSISLSARTKIEKAGGSIKKISKS